MYAMTVILVLFSCDLFNALLIGVCVIVSKPSFVSSTHHWYARVQHLFLNRRDVYQVYHR